VGIPYRFERPIRTARLTLRLMTEADVDDMHAYQSREDVCRYLLFEPRTRDEVAAKVAEYSRANTLEKDGDFLQLALVLATDLGPRVIGDSYFTIKRLDDLLGEIGWTMHPDFTGRGYAAEAANAVLDLAFGELGLHRMMAELDPRNDTSIALCKRLGMREEAFFVEDMRFKGGWADTGVYAILAREFTARTPVE
jgi:RimJ/RimL family protein N-acetyltransferase